MALTLRDNFWIIFCVSIAAIFITLTIDESDGAKATEHTYIDHVICKYNPMFTSKCTCKLKFITRLEKSFTAPCNVTKVVDNIIGSTQLYYKFRSGYKLFLVNVQVNLCDYVRKKASSKIIDIVLPTVKNYITTDPGQGLACPFSGRFDIKDLPLNGALLNNMFLPVGDYMVNLTVTTDSKEFIWNGKFYFNIPEGKTIEDDRMGR